MNKSIPQKPMTKPGTLVSSKPLSSSVVNNVKVNASITKSSNIKKVPTEWKQRLAPENYQLLRDTFLIFDQDGSGQIDPQEINKVLEELGLNRRNQYVTKIILALRDTNKKLNFDQFVDIVASHTGETKTKDGLRRVFNMYDPEETGMVDFEQIKKIARNVGETMTDDDLMDLMHSVFINKQTTSNQSLSFDEFYQVISSYYNKREGLNIKL